MWFCYILSDIFYHLKLNIQILSLQVCYTMDIDDIQKKYKYIVLNTLTGDCELLSSDRLVSQKLKDKYNLELSHMFIRRHIHDESYIYKDNILIKNIWLE